MARTMNTAESLKAEGQALIRWNMQEAARVTLDRVIVGLAHSRAEFTVEDVRAGLGAAFLRDVHPNAIGASMTNAAKRDLIRHSGRFVRATHPAGRARHVAVWLSLRCGAGSPEKAGTRSEEPPTHSA